MSSTAQITKKSRSNLAFAFLTLPPKKGAISVPSMRFVEKLTMPRTTRELRSKRGGRGCRIVENGFE